MRRDLGWFAWALVFFAGCGTDFGVGGGPSLVRNEAALGVSVAARQGLNVSWVRFDVSQVACDQAAAEPPTYVGGVTAPIAAVTLPGGLLALEGAPFDETSAHFFADHYFSLDPGCYRVEAVALDGDKQPLASCVPGRRDRIAVDAGKTVEVVLVIQCQETAENGAAMIPGANRPPMLTAFDYAPAKYIDVCGPAVTTCVTALDPDDDPLEFVWTHVSGPAPASGPTEVSSERLESGARKHCVRYTFLGAGATVFAATVFDLIRDGADGMIRVETYLADQGVPQASRDMIEFPVFVADCVAEVMAADGECAYPPGVCRPVAVPPPSTCLPESMTCRPVDLVPPPPTCFSDACRRPAVYGPLPASP